MATSLDSFSYDTQTDPTDNYFQLLGIKPAFEVQHAELSAHYQQLQSILHPDRHVTASPQEQRLAAQNSALVNEAYRVLTDDCERAIYLLRLKNAATDREQDTTDASDFLVEQMELRESIEEHAESPQKLLTMKTSLDARMRDLGVQFNQAYVSGNFEQARVQITKMQFFKKLKQQIKDKLI